MKGWALMNVRRMMAHHPGLGSEHFQTRGGRVIETCGGRYGAEGLRGLQGRVEPVLVLPGYRGAEDGLSTDGVRQDGGWRGVAGRRHHLLETLAGLTDRVLVSHEVRTETWSKHCYWRLEPSRATLRLTGCRGSGLEMMMVVRGRRAGVVAVAGRQAGRLVLQILDQVTRLDRVVNGSVGWGERDCMETFPLI